MSWDDIKSKAWEYAQKLEGHRDALADWVECEAITRSGAIYDKGTLVDDLEQADEWESVSWPNSMHIVETANSDRAKWAFEALEERARIGGSAYPFECQHGQLRLIQSDINPLYAFLLALSYTSPQSGTPRPGAHLFERIAMKAMTEMVGHPKTSIANNIVKNFHFGFPRPSELPGGFRDAVNHLCRELNEGGGYHNDPSRNPPPGGDGGLDILIGRSFRDGRGSSLLIVANCSAGMTDWFQAKLGELDGARWFKNHAEIPLTSNEGTAKCLILPRVVPPSKWKEATNAGGVVLDRLRIVELLPDLDTELLNECTAWVNALNLPTRMTIPA
jgi:hypothetical protein